MVEGARLESVYTGNCIKGSNPLVSAYTVLKETKLITQRKGDRIPAQLPTLLYYWNK